MTVDLVQLEKEFVNECRKLDYGPRQGYDQAKALEFCSKFTQATNKFHIIRLQNRFCLYNVPHCRNANGTPNPNARVNIELAKSIVDYGNRHTPDEWNNILKKDNWELPDTQIIYSTLRAFSFFRDNLPQSLNSSFHSMLADIFKESGTFSEPRKLLTTYYSGLATGTRILYQEQGNDTIVHRYGTTNEYAVNANIGTDPNHGVGADISTNMQEALQAILGTNDTTEIQNSLSILSSHIKLIRPTTKKSEEATISLNFFHGGLTIKADNRIKEDRRATAIRFLM
ncbi:hypothetical protein HY489_03480 [Candidatus Woesearchaeota archaeon]|nr:hypothetical protein [Candidatus Woesearchaeota archaeon]